MPTDALTDRPPLTPASAAVRIVQVQRMLRDCEEALLPPKVADCLAIHEFAQALPEMPADQYNDLEEDLLEHGLREPITLYPMPGNRYEVLDGRHRYRICCQNDIPMRFRIFEGTLDQARDYVLAANLHRRHLTAGQRAIAAAALLRACTASDTRPPTQQQVADSLGVSRRSVGEAATVLEHGDPALVEKVQTGELGLRAAAKLCKPQPEDTGSFPAPLPFAGPVHHPANASPAEPPAPPPPAEAAGGPVPPDPSDCRAWSERAFHVLLWINEEIALQLAKRSKPGHQVSAGTLEAWRDMIKPLLVCPIPSDPSDPSHPSPESRA